MVQSDHGRRLVTEAQPREVGVITPDSRRFDVPDDMTRMCGHCGDGVLSAPNPDEWVAGQLEPDQRVKFAVLHECYSCGLPTVVTWTAVGDAEGGPSLVGHRQSPEQPPPPLRIAEYADTAIDRYYEESWRCRRAGHRRAAMVMARATLQACFRRYLRDDQHGSFTTEMRHLEALAGPGWLAIGTGVRDFGNEWAHPNRSVAAPTWATVAESFRRMGAVLTFTAEMERVGHLSMVTSPGEGKHDPDGCD
jgi:hypothetical protein